MHPSLSLWYSLMGHHRAWEGGVENIWEEILTPQNYRVLVCEVGVVDIGSFHLFLVRSQWEIAQSNYRCSNFPQERCSVITSFLLTCTSHLLDSVVPFQTISLLILWIFFLFIGGYKTTNSENSLLVKRKIIIWCQLTEAPANIWANTVSWIVYASLTQQIYQFYLHKLIRRGGYRDAASVLAPSSQLHSSQRSWQDWISTGKMPPARNTQCSDTVTGQWWNRCSQPFSISKAGIYITSWALCWVDPWLSSTHHWSTFDLFRLKDQHQLYYSNFISWLGLNCCACYDFKTSSWL